MAKVGKLYQFIYYEYYRRDTTLWKERSIGALDDGGLPSIAGGSVDNIPVIR
jgi:hypothetical protein